MFPGRSRLARRERKNESVQQAWGLACRGCGKATDFHHGGMNDGVVMGQSPGQGQGEGRAGGTQPSARAHGCTL